MKYQHLMKRTFLRRTFALAALAMAFVSCLAVPARLLPITVTQPDGTMLTFYVRGDEMSHWLQTDDEVLLMQGDDGAYYYAITNADGLPCCSGMLAHNADERTEAEQAFVSENQGTASLGVENVVEKSKVARRQMGLLAPATRAASLDNIRGKKVTGKMKALVILVEFSDVSMTIEAPNLAFYLQLNQKGYNENGHIGSVHDYFYDQSYGQLDVEFDVAGPVTLPINMAYYGKNDAYGNDRHAGEMVCDACRLVDDRVDFSKYDNDGDGYVDQVYVMYAGYDEASSGVSSQIWAHKADLYNREKYYGDGEGVMYLDGVKVNKYACSSELEGNSGDMMWAIGTFCHEFSHCLGLMDVYDVSYKGGFGMQGFDLMASGSYCGPNMLGEVPCGYTAYERWYLGWLDFVELNNPASVKNMPSLGDAPVAYVMHNDNTPTEFFTLENRQAKGWYSYVINVPECHGMLVTHVDYNAKSWSDNSINTVKSHQRMSLVPADNNYGKLKNNSGSYFYEMYVEDIKGDLFPGYYGITSFTDDSHSTHGGSLFNINKDGTRKLGKPITNITESGGLISFDFKGGSADNVYNAIADVSVDASDAAVIYDMSGNVVKDMSVPGVYVVKENGQARKVIVR